MYIRYNQNAENELRNSILRRRRGKYAINECGVCCPSAARAATARVNRVFSKPATYTILTRDVRKIRHAPFTEPKFAVVITGFPQLSIAAACSFWRNIPFSEWKPLICMSEGDLVEIVFYANSIFVHATVQCLVLKSQRWIPVFTYVRIVTLLPNESRCLPGIARFPPHFYPRNAPFSEHLALKIFNARSLLGRKWTQMRKRRYCSLPLEQFSATHDR